VNVVDPQSKVAQCPRCEAFFMREDLPAHIQTCEIPHRETPIDPPQFVRQFYIDPARCRGLCDDCGACVLLFLDPREEHFYCTHCRALLPIERTLKLLKVEELKCCPACGGRKIERVPGEAVDGLTERSRWQAVTRDMRTPEELRRSALEMIAFAENPNSARKPEPP
jgi:hypothetical protein